MQIPDDVLREVEVALEWQKDRHDDAIARVRIDAPEDAQVEALCARYGYGAVIDAACRLWARKDHLGAFYIGGCLGDFMGEAALARLRKAMEAGTDEAKAFDNADWYWRVMDPDDSGWSPEEAISRSMLGPFCVCEIASNYSGPTRYGFVAPTQDDDTEFVHFATHEEAVAAVKDRVRKAMEDGKDG